MSLLKPTKDEQKLITVVVLASMLFAYLKSRDVSSNGGASGGGSGGGGSPGSSGAPRGLRNKNPLNLKRTNSQWQGKIPFHLSTDNTFEQFYEFKYGWRSNLLNMFNYICNEPGITLGKILHKWVHGLSGSFPENYVSFVELHSGVGVDRDTKFRYTPNPSSSDKVRMRNMWWGIFQAMAQFENGTQHEQEINSTRNEFDQGFDMAWQKSC